MNQFQGGLILSMTVLLIGCHGHRGAEKTASSGSDGPAMNSTNPGKSTDVVSAPAQDRPRSADAPNTEANQNVAPGSKSYTEKLGSEGTVDWTTGLVTASGIGYAPADTRNPTQARLMARRAAQSVAYRNLLEAFKAIRVDSSTTVKNYVTTTDEIEVRVSGMVQGIKELNGRDLEQGGYEVTLQMKLTGEASGAFAPKDAPAPRRLGTDKASPSTQALIGNRYTGLVVDARGKGVRPALVPRILTEDGQEAYSQSYVLDGYRRNQGIAAYVSDPSEAKTHTKVTDNPLFIKALRHGDNSDTDLVISNAAAQTIHGVKDHFAFLEKAQVLVIIDRRE
jgi:hypothetical protein